VSTYNYAEGTLVSVGKTKGEIEDLLMRHKATKLFTGQEDGRAIVGFEMADRRVQFELRLPAMEQFSHREDQWGHKKARTPEDMLKHWEQACRERWRALLLCIKAKLVSTAAGVETFEEAFLAQIVIPGQGTIGARIIPALPAIYEGQPMPPLLPPAKGAR